MKTFIVGVVALSVVLVVLWSTTQSGSSPPASRSSSAVDNNLRDALKGLK